LKKQGFNAVPAYRRFIGQRDLALEKLLQNTQMRITEFTQDAFAMMLSTVLRDYPSLLKQKHMGRVPDLRNVDHALMPVVSGSAWTVGSMTATLRRNAYMLANAGEAEAMARAGLPRARTHITKADLAKAANREMKQGASLQDKIRISYNRVRRSLMDALEVSLSLEESVGEAGLRLFRALPKRKFLPKTDKPTDVLKPVRAQEADKKQAEEPVASLSLTFVDEDDWSELLDAYKQDFVPKFRGPENVIGTQTIHGEVRNVYAWELERDVTQAFVEDVRAGQIDAAKQNGIIDFVWVAVLDDRTGEFDRWADGKLTSEIRAAIDSGKAPDSEFQSEVPPAHFNCRCNLAPATADLPEPPDDGAGDFDAWLRS
jgi:hypothetical protein